MTLSCGRAVVACPLVWRYSSTDSFFLLLWIVGVVITAIGLVTVYWGWTNGSSMLTGCVILLKPTDFGVIWVSLSIALVYFACLGLLIERLVLRARSSSSHSPRQTYDFEAALGHIRAAAPVRSGGAAKPRGSPQPRTVRRASSPTDHRSRLHRRVRHSRQLHRKPRPTPALAHNGCPLPVETFTHRRC